MKTYRLTDMHKGWFMGPFKPTTMGLDHFEVAIKRYKEGDYEPLHHHKVAMEFTVIVSGEVEMNGTKYIQDDIIVMEQNESTDFKCLTDVVTCVVKYPGVKDDKYLG